MKTLIWLFCLIPVVHIYGQDHSTLSKLESTYKGYITSCNKGKGKKALSYLDQNSRVFFELMLNDLWYADSNTLEKLPLAEKHLILLMRQINSHEQLVSFSPNSLAIYALSEFGPLGSCVVEGYILGDLREEKNKAYARLMVRGYTMDPEFEFTNENDHWKLSLIPFLSDTESHLLARFKKTNTSEKQFISFLIEACSGKPANPDIWKAVKK